MSLLKHAIMLVLLLIGIFYVPTFVGSYAAQKQPQLGFQLSGVKKDSDQPSAVPQTQLAAAVIPARERVRSIGSGRSDATFNNENVPLGVNLAEFKKALKKCKIIQNDGVATFTPLTTYSPPIEKFFPLVDGTYVGMGVAFGWVGALLDKHVDVYKFNCSKADEFDAPVGVFSKTDHKLIAYSKPISLKSASAKQSAVEIENQLKGICSSDVKSHDADSNDKSYGGAKVYVRYCAADDIYIVASANAMFDSVGQALIDIAYVSQDGWHDYIEQSSKERESKKSQNKEALKSQL